MLGVYVHLPFCPYLCPYCDFAKWPLRAIGGATLSRGALRRDLRASPSVPAATIYLGGGTPNAYDARTIVDAARAAARTLSGRARRSRSKSIPSSCATAICARYREAGDHATLDRRAVLRAGRDSNARPKAHRCEQIETVVARRAPRGCNSVSLDLMFAVPGQTPASWRRSLARGDRARRRSHLGLRSDGRRWYAVRRLARARTRRLFRRRARSRALRDRDRDAASEPVTSSTRSATSLGPDTSARTTSTTGPTASTSGSASAPHPTATACDRCIRVRSRDTWRRRSRESRFRREAERLEGRRRAGEAMMLALRTAQGVASSEFKERYGIDVMEEYAPVVASLCRGRDCWSASETRCG